MDKLVTLRLVERLKNSDFILESKMKEVNQNQNSKQPNWPDAMWKLYCTYNFLHVFYRIVFLKL